MFENNVKTEMKRKIYGFNNCPKGQELCLRFLLETEQRKHISTFHWLARSLHLSLVHLWGCIVWKIKGAAQLSWVRFSLNEFTTRILMYFIPANFFGICAHCPKCLTFKLKQKPMLLWALVIFFFFKTLAGYQSEKNCWQAFTTVRFETLTLTPWCNEIVPTKCFLPLRMQWV